MSEDHAHLLGGPFRMSASPVDSSRDTSRSTPPDQPIPSSSASGDEQSGYVESGGTDSLAARAAALLIEWRSQLEAALRRDDPRADEKSVEWSRLGVILRMYEILLQGAPELWTEVCHDDFYLEIIGPPVVPFVGKWVGMKDVGAATQRNLAFLQQQRVQFETVIAQGDKLIIIAYEEGIYRLTGRPYATHFFHCFFFRDSKLAGCREYVDGLRLAESMQFTPVVPIQGTGDQFISDSLLA
jgi:ketosteroid isomerase-like protein